jgi:hypothetical protein
MSRFIIALSPLLIAQQVNAACGTTANGAGCATLNGAVVVGPNGAAAYNKNTGQVHTTQPKSSYKSNQVTPGTCVQGPRGNSATKAVQAGCAYVNGKRVCG